MSDDDETMTPEQAAVWAERRRQWYEEQRSARQSDTSVGDVAAALFGLLLIGCLLASVVGGLYGIYLAITT